MVVLGDSPRWFKVGLVGSDCNFRSFCVVLGDSKWFHVNLGDFGGGSRLVLVVVLADPRWYLSDSRWFWPVLLVVFGDSR